MMSGKTTLLSTSAAAVLLLAGCGSGEVSVDDYRAATGEVCAEFETVIKEDRRQINRLGAEASQDPERFVKVVRKFQRDWDEFAAGLKAVERPPGEAARLEPFFADLSVSQDRVSDLAVAVGRLPGLVKEAEAVQRSQDAAQAQVVLAEARETQKEIRRAEAGFDSSIRKIENFTDSYPGLANCR